MSSDYLFWIRRPSWTVAIPLGQYPYPPPLLALVVVVDDDEEDDAPP